MRLTERDVRLIKDIALSHVLSRDQVLQLGYFDSITRVNARLRALVLLGLIRRLDTPYFAQSLYGATREAAQVVGERIARLLLGRRPSPRFLQHALAVTNVRIALVNRGATAWRFEQQLQTSFRFAGSTHLVRPDGLAVYPRGLTALEVDLGHVAPEKFRQKLKGYDAFVASGECERQWRSPALTVLTVTTGKRRSASLARLVPRSTVARFTFQTFEEVGAEIVGGWS